MVYHLPPSAFTSKTKNSAVDSDTGWVFLSTVPLTPALSAIAQLTSLGIIRLDVVAMQTGYFVIMPSVMPCLWLPSQQHSPLHVKLQEWWPIHNRDLQTFFFPRGIVVVLLLSTFTSFHLSRTSPCMKLLPLLVMPCESGCSASLLHILQIVMLLGWSLYQ